MAGGIDGRAAGGVGPGAAGTRAWLSRSADAEITLVNSPWPDAGSTGAGIAAGGAAAGGTCA
jgi:hypothetical protein